MGTHFTPDTAAPDYAREARQARLLCWTLSGLVVMLAVVAFTVPGTGGWAPIVAGMLMACAMSAHAFSAPPAEQYMFEKLAEPVEREATLVA